jgi:hypothetical protein
MKSTALEAFLCGVTLGIGATVLSLYTQKPARFITTIETISALGRERRAKEEAKRFRRERLKEVGFSDEEIEGIF